MLDANIKSRSNFPFQVQDVNDNKPRFANSYKCEILENSPTSTVVCYVVATDADSGNNAKLRYAIAATGAGTCPFSIDSVGIVPVLLLLSFRTFHFQKGCCGMPNVPPLLPVLSCCNGFSYSQF